MCIRDRSDSGARGSMDQIKQLAGMRGLLANTAGKTLEMPIRDVYKRQNLQNELFPHQRSDWHAQPHRDPEKLL